MQLAERYTAFTEDNPKTRIRDGLIRLRDTMGVER